MMEINFLTGIQMIIKNSKVKHNRIVKTSTLRLELRKIDINPEAEIDIDKQQL